MVEPGVQDEGARGELADAAPDASGSRHRTLVVGARTALIMILVAAVIILGLGVATLLLVGPPEADGWLRSVFGAVFGHMALGIALALGVPSAIGVWAMAGAAAAEAKPALSRTVRNLVALVGVTLVVVVGVVVLVGGRGPTVLDLGAIGLAALLILGLAGSVSFSPHRGRAILSLVASVLVWAGVAWFVAAATLA